MAEDPVREAATRLLKTAAKGIGYNLPARWVDAVAALREALAQPAPPSLTEDERSVLLYALNPIGTPKPNIDDIQKTVKSAREKLNG